MSTNWSQGHVSASIGLGPRLRVGRGVSGERGGEQWDATGSAEFTGGIQDPGHSSGPAGQAVGVRETGAFRRAWLRRANSGGQAVGATCESGKWGAGQGREGLQKVPEFRFRGAQSMTVSEGRAEAPWVSGGGSGWIMVRPGPDPPSLTRSDLQRGAAYGGPRGGHSGSSGSLRAELTLCSGHSAEPSREKDGLCAGRRKSCVGDR